MVPVGVIECRYSVNNTAIQMVRKNKEHSQWRDAHPTPGAHPWPARSLARSLNDTYQ